MPKRLPRARVFVVELELEHKRLRCRDLQPGALVRAGPQDAHLLCEISTDTSTTWKPASLLGFVSSERA